MVGQTRRWAIALERPLGEELNQLVVCKRTRNE